MLRGGDEGGFKNPFSGVNTAERCGIYKQELNPVIQEKLKVNGTVIEALPDTKFKIQLEDGREILAYLAGKMRLNYIKVMIGDKVTLELSPDETKGRIIRRL